MDALETKLYNRNKIPQVVCGPLYNHNWLDKITWE